MKEVVIYTTPTCEWCKKTKAFLLDKGVKFTEINVNDDNFRIAEMVTKSGQSGVPVIDIGGEIVIGYNEKKLTELLGL